MATPANSGGRPRFATVAALLAPFPGRLEFAARLALICALTTLVVEIYQTPEAALTAYVAFFVIKPDRMASIVVSIVMMLLVTLIIGAVLLISIQVIDQPFWRVTSMALISFCLLFAASASKLRPIAGILALITAYALDLLGKAQIGEIATRALLYAWLFVGIPAGVCIAVNLLIGPPPRRLAERALALRLRLSARRLRVADDRSREAFEEILREGSGEIPAWLKLSGAEKASPPEAIAALRQATQSTAAILSVVEVVARDPKPLLPERVRERISETLDEMAAILDEGGYPVEIALELPPDQPLTSPLASAALAELQAALTGFAKPAPPAPPAAKPAAGFFLPDAFTEPAHVHYALKTTGAAMVCYLVYSLLDWPGIHTCLITVYIVSLGTTAETIEKLTLRIAGCLVGAAAGIAAIVFLMPYVTSIGALMAIVFLAALVSGWIAAGSPRISYVGFQIAFAFFLCVIQGSAPAFDMTVARDRVIGILFGNLVVALVFTLIWPVSIAKRIDPALTSLLRRLAAMAGAGSRAKRWALAAETQAALGAIEQDLDLARYEPGAMRPSPTWFDRRREAADALASLQGPLLIAYDQDADVSGRIARRLDRLADDFEGDLRPSGGAAGAAGGALGPDVGPDAGNGTLAASPSFAFIEAPLATLERLVADADAFNVERPASYARP